MKGEKPSVSVSFFQESWKSHSGLVQRRKISQFRRKKNHPIISSGINFEQKQKEHFIIHINIDYNKIWEKVEKFLKIDFESKPIYGDDDKYIKAKIKIYAKNIVINFHNKRMPK